jgi:Iap family predicted aminopeptidase
VTRRHVVLLLTAFLLLGAAGVGARSAIAPPSAERLGEVVSVLAAPDMEGRRSGTAGGDHAARRIADWLADAGLRPAGDRGSFLQSFVLETSARVLPTSSLELVPPAQRRLELARDWTPHGGSLAGDVTGDVVFMGYGATLPSAGHDDYAGVDVRGKIVLALDGAPPHLTNARAGRLDKLVAAKRRGAAALLLVSSELPSPDTTAVRVGLVSGSITRAAADVMLGASGRSVAAVTKTLEDAPASFATGARAHIHVDLGSDEIRGANVIGVLPGTDPALADEAVVIGAHYDHLGLVGGVIHPGADDNASGTATVVGLARAFAAAGGTGRTLVFVLFGAEELGLIGSGHYVSNPVVPLARTVAMVNFDMVGRLGDRRITVAGGDSGSGLRALAGEAVQKEGITINQQGSPYGPSDHSKFYDAGVPVLFFHTGSHDDYHHPTDTADKIDADGMARVAAIAVRVIDRLATDPRPVYAKVTPPARRRGGDSGGGAFLGIASAPRAGADGLRLSSVLPGTGAARAGLREGDVIVRLAGVSVAGLEDLRAVIRARRPGDTVSVLYLRDGEPFTTSATLGTRID